MSQDDGSPETRPKPPSEQEHYVLKLYITGLTPNSRKAVENIKNICEEYLPGRYQLEVIDIYQEPTLAANHQIIAVPMLVKQLPGPERRLIGDMSDTEKVLAGLNLQKKAY